jgi:hypothetical protein
MDEFGRLSMTGMQTEHTFLIGCAAGPEEGNQAESSRHPTFCGSTD